MNPISAFLVQNIVGVYFFYGLAFFSLGLALILASQRTSTFKFARAIPAFAGFGIIHGIHEWFEMFQKIAAISSGHAPTLLEETVRIAILVASFLLLAAFGMLLLRPSSEKRLRAITPILILAGLWVTSTLIAARFLHSSPSETLLLADVLSRYTLGIPGAMLGAWALMVQQRTFRESAMPRFGRDLVWCTTALVLYGVVGQLFVHPSPLAPSTVLNSTLFLQWFGIPVQLFRGIMAAVLSIFMMRALDAFELESQQQLTAANEELRLATQELSLLLELSNLLATPMDLQERLEEVLTDIVASLHFPDAGIILLVSRRMGMSQERASVGLGSSSPAQEQRHDLALELGERCIAKGMAVCRHLDGSLIEFMPEEMAERQRCRLQTSPACTISLPLYAHQQVIGGLVLDQERQSELRDLSHEEFTIILSAAQQLGLSIENARLYQETQEHEKRLGELLRQVVEAQEAERKRIALELHDATGQSLTALALGLRGVESMLGTDPSKVAGQVEELTSYSTAALGELRRIIADLRPSQLDDLGLVPAIQWYLQEFERLYHISTEFEVEGRRRLASEYETVLFRIIQEALTNTAKHARANRATVGLEISPAQIVVTIEDDGRGFNPDQVLQRDRPAGWGLLGIQERALLLGGQCEFDSAPGNGTRIRVSVPLVMERDNVQDPTLTR